MTELKQEVKSRRYRFRIGEAVFESVGIITIKVTYESRKESDVQM